ncbi:MAG: hypothetical protein ACLPWF_02890 [Bryobacteraceae bacterium]
MRPLFVVGVLGTVMSISLAEAQSSPESNARAHKKQQRPSTAMDSLFENGPDRPRALEDAARESAERKAKEKKPDDSTTSADAPPAAPAPIVPTVQAVPPGPPQKNLTGEEFKLIHVGSTEKQVFEILGPPSSKVVVPDDDHLRESLQYWAKGAPMGTVRLDNGRVVEIETKAK